MVIVFCMQGQMAPVSQLQARLTGARMPQQPVMGMAPVGVGVGGADGGQANMAQQQRMKMVRNILTRSM